MKTDKLLRIIAVLFTATLMLLPSLASAQQAYHYARNTYTHGQHAEVAYEGWRENEDGTITLTFGYFNHNWEEELDVAVGPNNFFSPGPADRNQPTHFLPRRNRFTFDVIVPGDFRDDEDNELVWELTSPNGLSRKAYATLRPDYKINNVIIMSETGALGAGTSDATLRANIAPVAELIGDEIRTIRVGQSLSFQTRVSDDGVPKTFDPMRLLRRFGGAASAFATPEMVRKMIMSRAPIKPTVSKHNGLFLSWNVYRAPESTAPVQDIVHFDPPQIKPWEDTRTSANSPWGPLWIPPAVPEDGIYDVSVSFDEPGTYLLWGRADDGGLYHDQYLTVNVTP